LPVEFLESLSSAGSPINRRKASAARRP